MQRFWKGLAAAGVVAKKYHLYLWLPLILIAFCAGVLVSGKGEKQATIFDEMVARHEHSAGETVYVHRGSAPSNLFHFSDCRYFSASMSAIGPARDVYQKTAFKPCPKCCVVVVGTDGFTRFLGEDAPAARPVASK